MAQGFVSRTAVVDWVSRTELAGKVAITLETCHAVEVLHEAFTCHGRLEMVNSDQGRQLNAQAFVHAVKEQGYQFSMDGRGAWTSTHRMKRMP
jgi:putative transposase